MNAEAKDGFEATFTLSIARELAWERLLDGPLPSDGDEVDGDRRRYWLPGFDAEATVTGHEVGTMFHAVKDDEPCAGTDIVVTLDDNGSGTRITVVQSGFGDWMRPHYEMMAIGWRHIVADLETYLARGVHVGRHLREWGDLGGDVEPMTGGIQVTAVRDGSLAHRLNLVDNDLLVALGGAPVSNLDDLVTVLRVLRGRTGDIEAEWIRGGTPHRAVTKL